MADFELFLLLLVACGRRGGGFDAFVGLVLGPCQECMLLSSSCLWYLGFDRVFWVVSPGPELSKPPGDIINSYEMYLQMY